MFSMGQKSLRVRGRQFAEMVVYQFDEMLEQSRKYPLVFAVSVHPFIIGQPFRLRAFRDAIRHIVRHRDRLWITGPARSRAIAKACRKAQSRGRSSAWQPGPDAGSQSVEYREGVGGRARRRAARRADLGKESQNWLSGKSHFGRVNG
jgi:hypothetical protein